MRYTDYVRFGNFSLIKVNAYAQCGIEVIIPYTSFCIFVQCRYNFRIFKKKGGWNCWWGHQQWLWYPTPAASISPVRLGWCPHQPVWQ